MSKTRVDYLEKTYKINVIHKLKKKEKKLGKLNSGNINEAKVKMNESEMAIQKRYLG